MYVIFNNELGYIQYIERWWDGVVEYGYTHDIHCAKRYQSSSSALRAARAYRKRTNSDCRYIELTNSI